MVSEICFKILKEERTEGEKKQEMKPTQHNLDC